MDLTLFVLFAIVALIVSLDVVGLTISKSATVSTTPVEQVLWALNNGFWHAALLALYAFTFSEILEFLKYDLAFITALLGPIIQWIDENLNLSIDLMENLEKVVSFVAEHVSVMFGLIALAIVWNTYDGKIVSIPAGGNYRDLPPIARLLYHLLAFPFFALTLTRKSLSSDTAMRIFRWQAEAALVAVDMLALAVLMTKMEFLTNDTDRYALVGLVFVVVAFLAWRVGAWTSKFTNMGSFGDEPLVDPTAVCDSNSIGRFKKTWWAVTLRLLEPWFIFFFALELVGFLLTGEPSHSVGYVFGSCILLYALVKKHGLNDIICAVCLSEEAYGQDVEPIEPWNPSEAAKDVLKILSQALYWFVIFLIFIVFLTVVWGFVTDSYSENPALDAVVVSLFSAIGLGVVILSTMLPRMMRVLLSVLNWIMVQRRILLFFILALLLASVVPIYEELTSNMLAELTEGQDGPCRFKALGLQENHVHVLQVAMMIGLIFMWSVVLNLVIDFLERRNQREYEGFVDAINDSYENEGHDRFNSRTVVRAVAFVFVLSTLPIIYLNDRIYAVFGPCFG